MNEQCRSCLPSGLSAEQAARQLALDGPNELPRPPRRTGWHILLEVAREPMFQLLATAVAIYFILGDRAEASVLLAFLGVIVAITWYRSAGRSACSKPCAT
ncbi:cation-transporting P-type ATPase [Thauera humireducens]|uniref:cation-transporting P-type ATPase n=1 Tax=Thauera humireducens TaxID=1134435 RepID=UPI00311DF01C